MKQHKPHTFLIIDVHSALASIDYRLKWKFFAILIWMLLT